MLHVINPRSASKNNQRERVVTLAKEFIWENFSALEGFVGDAKLNVLREWTTQELHTVADLMWQRFDDGYVRDCHGDLHLANLVRLPGGITTFDCIEFSTDLRHIDVTADIAFLTMDLVERGRHDLAAHFLNRYLECTGDYGCASLLSLFFRLSLSREGESRGDPKSGAGERRGT